MILSYGCLHVCVLCLWSKPGVPAFIVNQPDGPMKVLQERAEEIGVRSRD